MLSRVVAVVLISTTFVAGLCPHESSLAKWSESSTWVNNGGVPTEGSSVVIKNNILLDQNLGFDLNDIEIEEGGQLVFSPEVEISLRLRYILVRGRLDIGSEDCPYTGKATITLIGIQNETYSVPDFGRKFIGVDGGGRLEIHGEYKRPWTKLTSTLEKFPEEQFIFRDKVTKEDNVKGLLVYSFDPNTGKPDREMGVFGIRRTTQKMTDKDIVNFINYVDDIPNGNIIAMAVRKSIISRDVELDVSLLYEAVEILAFGSVTGKSKIRELVFYDGYSLILVKGDPSQTVEEFESYKAGGVKQTSTATMIQESKKMKIEVTSFTSSRGFGKSFVDFQVTNTDKTLPIINLVDDVSSWQEGDEIVIASTDYNWAQHEYAKVIKCDTCNETQVRISLTPEFTHYGKIYHNVDMRAEVAVLTRNVVIQGEMANGDDRFGGHIKVRKNFERVRVENAELAHLGQSDSLGNYPMHWHMCENTLNPTYIRSCAIHHTYARCVTVHGTHNVQVIDNACVESLGHGYFLEDGGERDTVFDGNLGFGQRKIDTLTPTDEFNPTTFWITNPYTTLRNNDAAGSEGNGIWYVFPDKPMGPSASKNFMELNEAKKTAITEFTNNVAHSNKKYGLRIDDRLSADGSVLSGNQYQPSTPVTINKLTAYKNNMKNVHIRGDDITVNHASISDSVVGILMIRSWKGNMKILNSVILGDSDNMGLPTVDSNGTVVSDRSHPVFMRKSISLPRYGVDIFSGPLAVDSVWFSDFRKTEEHEAGALHFGTGFGITSPANTVSNAKFGFSDPTDGNRFFEATEDHIPLTHRLYHSIQDVDGSLTTLPNSWIVQAVPFYMTDNCENRFNWNLAVCDESFVQMRAMMSGAKTNKMNIHRLDNMASISLQKNKGLRFSAIVGKMYGVSWENGVPGDFGMRAVNMDLDDTFVIGACVPIEGVLDTRIFGFRKVEVSNLTELELATGGGHYFYDREIGMLFLKLKGRTAMTQGQECRTFCPGFRVVVKSGDLSDGNCIKRYADKYVEHDLRSLLEELHLSERSLGIPAVLPKTSAEPPVGFGAGATRNGS